MRDVSVGIEAVRRLPGYARLVWGLLRDGRIPPPQKMILVGVVGYLLMPFDIIPDFIPVLGQLDDLAVVLLALDLFIRVAPREVVAEHLARISRDEDNMRHDMEQVQRLLGERFVGIRNNLDRILQRERARLGGTDAASALERWQERGAKGEDRKGRT
ncbi:MAG: YkvA family protein [Candidatus Limnocylindria bacterium]